MCVQFQALFDYFSVTNKCFIVHCAGFLAILHVHHLYPWQLISRCVRPREIDYDRNTNYLIEALKYALYTKYIENLMTKCQILATKNKHGRIFQNIASKTNQR